VTDGSQSHGERSVHKERELLKRLLREKARQTREAPVSFGQERIWFLDQLAPASAAYCETISARMNAEVSLRVLTRALNDVVRRHEILRTTFAEVDGRPVQRIAAELRLSAPVVDLTEVREAARPRELHAVIEAQSQRPFDLRRGPLLRLTLVRLHGREYVVVLTFHHIVGDAWSVGVLWRELLASYLVLSTGTRSPLPTPPIQYADYARWQRKRFEGEKLKEQLARLKESLSDLPILELPTDRPRPAVQSLRGATRSFEFPEELEDALELLGREEGATPFMTNLMAFELLLSRYTGSEDIVVGSTVSGRDRAELEGLIGFFVNMVPLRTSLRGNPTIRELLRRVRQTCLDAYAHQEVPFERLVEELRPERSLSQTPLFQVLFVHHRDLMAAPDVPGADYDPIPIDLRRSKFDLTMYTWQGKRDQGLMGSIEYCTDLFDPPTIDRMVGHLRVLMEAVSSDPDRRLTEYTVLTPEERRQLTESWAAGSTADYPGSASLSELFERQVGIRPDAIAVVSGDTQVSYGYLDAASNRLARHLASLGVAPDVCVAVFLERSEELVLGLLGILKAGGAYVPLDPDYPAERLAFMLNETRARAVLAEEHLRHRLPESDAAIVCLSEAWRTMGGPPGDPLRPGTTAENLAYLTYTSGSTGAPKGVAVCHRSVSRLLFGSDYARLGPSTTTLHLSSLSFDASTFELWGALLHGGRCVMYPERVPTFEQLGRWIESHGVNTLWLTASLFNLVIDEAPEALRGVEQLLIGGESLSVRHVRLALERLSATRIVNGYGPSEGTTFTCCYAVPEEIGGATSIPIGTPISNSRVYVLDRNQEPVPIGVSGELYIGGAGLARGYLSRGDWTAERFVPDGVGPPGGGRLYRTGDRVRWRATGVLEFQGRLDTQVKVRGFRIELGEIESTLASHPGVREAVVAAAEDGAGGKRLVAYLVPRRPGLAAAEVEEFLARKLPRFMIPASFVLLEELPLGRTGKLDRSRLPLPSGPARRTRPFVSPRNPTEEKLARIWSEVLDLEAVGVEDNFFELGGHSLLATQLSARVREAFQVEVPLVRLFERPTIAGLAEALLAGSVEPETATAADLRSEAVLDPSITVSASFGNTAFPSSVFLTGATGFLGAFLLRELLATTSANVHCLVRAASAEEARNRLQAALDSFSLGSLEEPGGSSRIIPVPGDLSRPYLGLSNRDFDELASRIEVIYHNGAMVNVLYPYAVHRAANVLGTQEVLRLASRIRLKPVHYVSTTGVASSGGEVIREEMDLDDMPPPGDGYSQSKWVAERLVREARSRGFPVCIYRPGRITGHSRTGVGNNDDLFSRLLKACVQLGQVPELDDAFVTDIVPVDYVSQALAHLSLQESSLGRVFHLVHPRPIEWRRVIEWIGELGYPLETIPHDVWIAERNRLGAISEDPMTAALSSSPVTEPGGSLLRPPRFECRNTLDGLEGTPIVCAPVDRRLLETYFSYWIQSGYLPPPRSDHGRFTVVNGLRGSGP
jgi:amino acid adenylation domain-containing protein/thioester reductase-like protein